MPVSEREQTLIGMGSLSTKGAILRLREVKHYCETGNTLGMTIAKGKVLVVCVLGIEDQKPKKSIDLEAAMNKLGWHRAPNYPGKGVKRVDLTSIKKVLAEMRKRARGTGCDPFYNPTTRSYGWIKRRPSSMSHREVERKLRSS